MEIYGEYCSISLYIRSPFFRHFQLNLYIPTTCYKILELVRANGISVFIQHVKYLYDTNRNRQHYFIYFLK